MRMKRKTMRIQKKKRGDTDTEEVSSWDEYKAKEYKLVGY